MATTDRWLSIKEALKILKINGVGMSQAALGMAIIRGTVKSEKMFSARVISSEEVSRLVAERKVKKIARGK